MPRSSASWRRVEQLHREAEIGKAHRDAAAHRAGADDRGGVDRAQRRIARDVGQFRDLALGEEGIAQRPRLVGIIQLVEQLALAPHAFVERQRAAPPRPPRCSGRAPSGCGRAARSICASPRKCRDRPCLGELVVAVADARQRPLVGDAARERDRRLAADRRSGDELVDDAELLRLFGRDMTARDDHLHRRLRADQPRQPLRPAAARQDADQHLGQADLGARHRDAVMAGERDLEPAAQRIAVDRRDDRLGARIEDLVRARPGRRRRGRCRTGGCRRRR